METEKSAIWVMWWNFGHGSSRLCKPDPFLARCCLIIKCLKHVIIFDDG